MDFQRKSEIELKYFLERRLVTVANSSGNQKELNHGSSDDLPRPKNKYQQKLSAAKNVSNNQSRLKKSSSCNELVLQFEQHMRQQQHGPFQPAALFQGVRKQMLASEVFVDPSRADHSPSPSRQPRRPLMANRDIFEKHLDPTRRLNQPLDPVQRIVNQHSPSVRNAEKVDGNKPDANPHKVVIYFGDSIGNNRRTTGSVGDLVYASRAAMDEREGQPNRRNDAANPRTETNDVMKQLKSVLEEKKHQKDVKVPMKPAPPPPPPPPPPMPSTRTSLEKQQNKVEVSQSKPPKEKPPRKDKLPKQGINSVVDQKKCESKELSNQGEVSRRPDLPDFVESVTNGVINIKIDGSYNVARDLVQSVAMGSKNKSQEDSPSEPQSFDWSFVQEWRSR